MLTVCDLYEDVFVFCGSLRINFRRKSGGRIDCDVECKQPVPFTDSENCWGFFCLLIVSSRVVKHYVIVGHISIFSLFSNQ